jgi:beta-lactamase regulating signal transducer with metallopeptidase domain
MNFFYFFIKTLLHSLWQAALLLCAYLLVNLIGRNYHPLQKRNFLYLLLFTQFCISSITFFCFFYSYSFQSTFGLSEYFQKSHIPFLKNYYGLVFSLYITIVTIKILQLIFQWTSFKNNYTSKLIRSTAELKIFTNYHANLLCIQKSVKLWFSSSIKTPVTFGFFKPVILLPIALINNISTQQAELIILHELIHIKSKDYLLNWFLLAMETIYFFNPFIKIAAEKLKLEREKNSDIQVLNYQYSGVEYAETLFQIAQNNIPLKPFQLGLFKNQSQLYKRISFFSTEKNLSFKKLNAYFLSMLFILLTAVTTFVMVSKKPLAIKSFAQAYSLPLRDNFQNKSSIKITSFSKEIVTFKENKKKTNSTLNKENKKSLSPNNFSDYLDIESESMYTPVVYNELTDSTREVIYNVETKNKTITQSYKLVKKNGVWVFKPQWMIVETRPDSLQSQIKDSIHSSPSF